MRTSPGAAVAGEEPRSTPAASPTAAAARAVTHTQPLYRMCPPCRWSVWGVRIEAHEVRVRIDRAVPARVDLEVQVRRAPPRVAGVAHRADDLPGAHRRPGREAVGDPVEVGVVEGVAGRA